jgi:hypothetical protein
MNMIPLLTHRNWEQIPGTMPLEKCSVRQTTLFRISSLALRTDQKEKVKDGTCLGRIDLYKYSDQLNPSKVMLQINRARIRLVSGQWSLVMVSSQ